MKRRASRAAVAVATKRRRPGAELVGCRLLIPPVEMFGESWFSSDRDSEGAGNAAGKRAPGRALGRGKRPRDVTSAGTTEEVLQGTVKVREA